MTNPYESVSGNVGDGPVVRPSKLDNPWFRRMYESAGKFYERDNVLNSNDRYELFKTFRSIARAELIGGWFGFAMVFVPPFFVQYRRTGAIKGVKVPRNFMFGLAALFGSTQVAGSFMLNRKMAQLDPDGYFSNRSNYGDDNGEASSKSSKQRQFEMLDLLKKTTPTMWSSYFYMTYNNPERRFSDPKKLLKEMEENPNWRRGSFLNQRSPFNLYSGSKFDKKEGVLDANHEREPVAIQNRGIGLSSTAFPMNNAWGTKTTDEDSSGNSWASIRANNGRIPDQDDKKDDDSLFGLGEISQAEFDNLVNEERGSTK